VKLGDFGIAKKLDASADMARTQIGGWVMVVMPYLPSSLMGRFYLLRHAHAETYRLTIDV
jgi:ABC-type uncharacterized transport system permease subunit